MAMEDTDSCSSRVQDTSAAQSRQQRQKLEVYNDVLHRLKSMHNEEAAQPGFDDELWAHFNRLPARYALDVNVERAEDVLMHKRLLHLARDSVRKPAIEVHLVQVHSACDGNSVDSAHSSSPQKETAHNSNHEDLNNRTFVNADSSVHVSDLLLRSMHEITISTDDKPKLLSQLTSLLADLGLNIQEAHAFSTTDGYSLDVFVVEGWPCERTEQLKSALDDEVVRIENLSWENHRTLSPARDQALKNEEEYLNIPNDGTDVWEIEARHLKFVRRIACGACGELYKGTYCSQDVAIKVLKPECVNPNTQRDFAQEVFIMRKVRHKNVVQFIGACTRPPSLCIVTEYMPGGSVYDQLHRQKGGFKLPALLRVALDVAKGMSYLHQNNIIHRDLKSANLLIDENGVVKVADFGVARVKSQSGIMTAETGTYRWMAPEIIEHKPYDHKADVFSFGVVLWELLTAKLPHEYLTPLQAAVGVVQKGLRPGIPKHTDPRLAELLRDCWEHNSCARPDFSEIVTALKQMAKEVGAQGGEEKRKDKSGGFLSVLRRSNS